MRILLFIVSLILAIPTGTQIFACTGFFITGGNKAIVGNNEDYFNTTPTSIMIKPPEGDKYGSLFFGFGYAISHYGFGKFNPQGGINDQGLFFDAYATPPLEVAASSNKPKFKGHPFEVLLAECATVEEAISLFRNHDLNFMKKFQLFIADRTGQSAIIEGDNIIRKSSRYQVVTNYYQSNPALGNYPCKRYETAIKILEKSQDNSIEQLKKILEKTHVENVKYNGLIVETLYSNIYDLKKGLIYVYYKHDFRNEVVINLKKEFSKGKHHYNLSSLFPK